MFGSFEQWKCLRFSSSRRLRTFQLCKSSTSLSWRRGSLFGLVPKTIEILSLQYIDKVIDVVVWSSFRVQAWRRQPSSHNCSRRPLDKVVDMPVCASAVQQGCGRPCDHAGGSVPDSVHRRNWWTFQLATVTSSRLSAWRFMAAVRVFF